MTRVAWETRLALADHEALRLPNEPLSEWSPSIRRRIEGPAEVLVRSLFMLDEHPLTSRVAGTSRFAEEYSSRGSRDRRGRSLYELDLARRLYRYRFSPLIYSEQFAGLPPEAHRYIISRVRDVLAGEVRSVEFAGITESERRALGDILRDTLPGFEDGSTGN